MSPLAGAALFAVLLVVLVVGFLLVMTYNSVVALRTRIDKAWGNVEVALKQRHDQLAEIGEQHERRVQRVSPLDGGSLVGESRPQPIGEQGAVSAATSRAVRSLLAVVESYPQIRSQENVLRLQAEIERLEQQIADRRELYNDQVYRYNATIAQVPAVILAGLLGWLPRAFFDAEPAADERPSVELRGPAGPGADGPDPNGDGAAR